MPVYEYECARCGATTELLRPMRDMDQPAACAQCGSKKTRRAHSVFTAGAGSGPKTPGGLPGRCAHCSDAGGGCPMGR